MELSFEIFYFLTNTSILTKHQQNLRGSNIKLLDFVSFLQKVTLKGLSELQQYHVELVNIVDSAKFLDKS